MDKERAHEIISSTGMINVTYNGAPIYINSINDEKGTATVYPIDQPKNMQEVSLTSLSE
ncbi:H-type small acid-soluble spore protein [Anaeromicropila herbilytica]|uniref:SASP H n=1 Tax=Anaeromicropila herbilytica TaxID=2785025 RepID=A0A7R7EII6_9FIRM|nr:H-type small acid-soluble spore protein [Anaeromicropila herbilytica]BCN29398.1 hypothetical protein bsdtb5_06930 [Anaeromicropila herbilytica]